MGLKRFLILTSLGFVSCFSDCLSCSGDCVTDCYVQCTGGPYIASSEEEAICVKNCAYHTCSAEIEVRVSIPDTGLATDAGPHDSGAYDASDASVHDTGTDAAVPCGEMCMLACASVSDPSCLGQCLGSQCGGG